MPIIPAININNYDGTKTYDLYSLLLSERIIFLSGEVNDDMANLIVSEILYLTANDGKSPITIYINSPGGSVTSGLAIYDAMKISSCPIKTIGVGLCASMGAFLLSSGTKGYRFCYPNAEVMIHQPLGGSEGQVTDLEIMTKRFSKIKRKLNEIMAINTSQPLEKIEHDTDRNYFLTSEEAKNYGLIDGILSSSDLSE